jgi:hypothetical protein
MSVKSTESMGIIEQITLNSKAIAKLKGNQVSLNLLPALSQGIN